jgi:hypothetical protein
MGKSAYGLLEFSGRSRKEEEAMKQDITTRDDLLTFAKVTERLRQIPFTPLDDQKTHRWMNDNCNNPDPAIEAKVDWWDVKSTDIAPCAI